VLFKYWILIIFFRNITTLIFYDWNFSISLETKEFFISILQQFNSLHNLIFFFVIYIFMEFSSFFLFAYRNLAKTPTTSIRTLPKRSRCWRPPTPRRCAASTRRSLPVSVSSTTFSATWAVRPEILLAGKLLFLSWKICNFTRKSLAIIYLSWFMMKWDFGWILSSAWNVWCLTL